MPATSEKQKRFMQAVANNPKFAKKAGVPQSVGREFTKGDDMKYGSKKMAMDGKAKTAVRQSPKPMTEKELENISPAARRMMEQKRRDVKQEKKQKDMEDSVRGKKMAKGGDVESRGKSSCKTVKMAKGSSVSKRADGCAMKGRTKGRMI